MSGTLVTNRMLGLVTTGTETPSVNCWRFADVSAASSPCAPAGAAPIRVPAASRVAAEVAASRRPAIR